VELNSHAAAFEDLLVEALDGLFGGLDAVEFDVTESARLSVCVVNEHDPHCAHPLLNPLGSVTILEFTTWP